MRDHQRPSTMPARHSDATYDGDVAPLRPAGQRLGPRAGQFNYIIPPLGGGTNHLTNLPSLSYCRGMSNKPARSPRLSAKPLSTSRTSNAASTYVIARPLAQGREVPHLRYDQGPLPREPAPLEVQRQARQAAVLGEGRDDLRGFAESASRSGSRPMWLALQNWQRTESAATNSRRRSRRDAADGVVHVAAHPPSQCGKGPSRKLGGGRVASSRSTSRGLAVPRA